VASRVGLPPHLSNLHDVFHVSQHRKYVPDPSHVIQRDDVQVRDNLTVKTLPVRIKGREMKRLRGKEIPLVKVVWEGAAGESLTWELWPFDDLGLICPITSKAQLLNGQGLIIECNSLAGTRWILACFWHSSQPLANSMQFFSIVGQYTPCRNKSHFILWPVSCVPQAPLCVLETAKYASVSSRHLSKTPFGVFLKKSPLIKT